MSAQALLQRWGKVEMSPAILTRIGIRVPDVAWASSDFVAEIDEKIGAYLSCGAKEVWFAGSSFPVVLQLPPPVKDRP